MSYALFCFKHFLVDLLVSRIFIVYLYHVCTAIKK